jgi:hypothetical protein
MARNDPGWIKTSRVVAARLPAKTLTTSTLLPFLFLSCDDERPERGGGSEHRATMGEGVGVLQALSPGLRSALARAHLRRAALDGALRETSIRVRASP